MKVKITNTLLTFIILLSASPKMILGQNSNLRFSPQSNVLENYSDKPGHTINFETGMFHRGLVGVSYNKLFVQKKRLLLGGGAGAGIGGVPFGGGINQFYYSTLFAGFGFQSNSTQFYVSSGVDFKYVNYYIGNYDETIKKYVSTHHEGFGAMPFFGLTIIEGNLFIQFRSAPLFLMNKFKIDEVLPGVGVSMGIIIR